MFRKTSVGKTLLNPQEIPENQRSPLLDKVKCFCTCKNGSKTLSVQIHDTASSVLRYHLCIGIKSGHKLT